MPRRAFFVLSYHRNKRRFDASINQLQLTMNQQVKIFDMEEKQ